MTIKGAFSNKFDIHSEEFKTTLVVLYVAIVSLVFTLIVFLEPISEENYKNLSDTMFVVEAIIAGILIYYVAQLYGIKTINGRIWALMALGIFLWALGETIWAYYEVIKGEDTPYPSVADVAWIMGYPFLFIALIMQSKMVEVPLKREEIGALISFVGIISIITIAYLIEPIIAEETGPDYSVSQKITDLAYPTMDLFLLFFVGLIFLKFRGGNISKSWLLLLLGFFIMALADIFFAYQCWQGTYETAAFPKVDLLWIYSYAIFAVGAWYTVNILRVVKTS